MPYALRWTDTAIDALERQIEFVVGRDPVAAAGIIDRVFDKLLVLTENPELGPVAFPSAEPAVRRLLIDRYLVYYEVHATSAVIRILTIRHVRQAQPKSSEDAERGG